MQNPFKVTGKQLYQLSYHYAVMAKEKGGRQLLPHEYTFKICTPRKVLNQETNKINLN
jgi:hypothetical protein